MTHCVLVRQDRGAGKGCAHKSIKLWSWQKEAYQSLYCDEENLFRPDPGIKLTYKEIGARNSVLIGSKLK